MKRVGALLGAVVMVVAALAVRGTLDGDEADGDDGRKTTGSDLVCPVELRTACDRAGDVEAEGAGATADRLLDDDGPGLDGAVWIVPEAWARLVIDERARLGLDTAYELEDEPLASSRVVLAIWDDRAEQLAAACARRVDWACLAEQDGTSLAGGDRVRTGAPVIDSATGLSVAAAQAANLLGTDDYAANDFTGTFNSMASRLATGQRDDPVRAMRTQGPGRLTAAGSIEADAADLSTNFGTISPVTDVDPAVRVDVGVLVPVGTQLDDDTRRALQAALIDAGWDEPARGPSGLPAGGVLAALRTFWNENR